MSIEQLKKILESERNEMANRAWGFEGTSIREAGYYKRGHEAATNRLLPLLEEAVEVIKIYGEELDWDGVNNPAYIQDRGKKAREFISELTKMAEIVNPGHYTIDAESFDKLVEDFDKEPSEQVKKAREKFLQLKKESWE